MCLELHGKVFEDESENLPALPGIPDDHQRKHACIEPESGRQIRIWNVINLFFVEDRK